MMTPSSQGSSPQDDHDENSSTQSSSHDIGKPGSSSSSYTSSAGDVESAGTGSSGEPKDIRDTIIKHEDKAVRNAKCLVAFAVIACAAAVAVSVHFLGEKSEQRSFELEYDGFVTNIKALVRWEVRYNFALMDQLSASITIASGLLDSTFPFHMEPQFEITGGFVDGMGGIMGAAFAPLVKAEERQQWEDYSVENQGWIEQSAYLEKVHPIHRDALHGTIQDHEHDRRRNLRQIAESGISDVIYKWEDGNKVPEVSQAGKVFAPLWQVSPADAAAVNVNLLSDPRVADLYATMLKTKASTLSQSTVIGDLFHFLFDPEEKMFKTDPHGLIMGPVYSKIEENPTLVGFVIGVTSFGNLLDRLLPQGVDGIIGVIKDNCGNIMSFELSSGKAYFLGYEDMHDGDMDEYASIEENIEMYEDIIDGLCAHDLYLYPTKKLRASYSAKSGAGIYIAIYAVAFSLMFVLMGYDHVVKRRQDKTMQSALHTRALVTSLFPERIARKLVNEAHHTDKDKNRQNSYQSRTRFENFMSDKGEVNTTEVMKASKPLAELFPEATIMFGDLVGFTAWSSIREPHQVFMLLETIYASFDTIATRRGVFKVETVGDCYVAVCGLPNPCKDHYTVMARFAHECVHQLTDVLQRLEVELGPDTQELGVRVGLHSGPVTAGVLRGDRARFQLFGDTVNTTARIESTGDKNRIHISDETAKRLIAAGKEHWVTLREDQVVAKGKGEILTYWLKLKNDAGLSAQSSEEKDSNSNSVSEKNLFGKGRELQANDVAAVASPAKQDRIIDWNVDLLQRVLKNIVARRQALGVKADAPNIIQLAALGIEHSNNNLLNEVQDVIMLPKYDANVAQAQQEIESVELDPEVISQLHKYVETIAAMYCDNPFHNFEHASHVTMSCVKLMSRIVAPDIDIEPTDDNVAKSLHDHTYGITSDPLTQFAVMLSALVHDVDHPGVPNAQLIKENHKIAAYFKNKSFAEQNSIHIAWGLLMEDCYIDLRRTIFATVQELHRFRQLLVNAVMATDVMDKELGQQRKVRWNNAFSNETATKAPRRGSASEEEDTNGKATIVIEYLIQAADVSHTMQHWLVYKKWNSRLFEEMYRAYVQGRSEKDPSESWYKGEIGFFDFYVIPLAKKLKDCGVFGVSSEECLSYAEHNRQEWATKGRAVVSELVEKVKKEESAR